MCKSAAMKALMKLREKGIGGYKSDYFGWERKKKTVTIPVAKITPAKAPMKLTKQNKSIYA